MKTYIYILLFLLLPFSVLCQDLNNLDNKMGFNKFKLESSYDLYKSQLSYYITGYDKVVYYKYTGTDILRVFNVFVKEINLGFYNNSLYTISIKFISINKYNELTLQNKLQDLFGNQNITYNTINGNFKYDWSMLWESKNVYLQLDKISCDNEFEPCLVNLFMISKKLRTEINNASF